ncbi:D-Ala-D-Ala carboxypeptidase family metallohydrolase [Microvirga vignae]|uniref:D-Ala-D-Ala carboxypeptidase family metallohydrolase n=1 Tax=Microvirga vignae TaxID=1225564 RepID=UPI00069BC609|nr:D-Ala-D-Ala carboxypeptidase family metallohydrolase [Microvirga vignae]
MSTELNVRRAPWLAFVTSACLAGLSPNLANAQSPYPQPTGIVIPIPISNPDPSPATDPLPKTLPKTKALRRALSKALPKIEYSSLPSNDRITDPATTGSLPNASTLNNRTLSGFASLVTQGTITLRASAPTNCLPGSLQEVVADVASKFGPVSVESTHRSTSRNWRAGGARHSLHLSCRAIDFRVRTRTRGVMAYLSSRPEVGGIKMYRNGLIHIDNGTRRSW